MLRDSEFSESVSEDDDTNTGGKYLIHQAIELGDKKKVKCLITENPSLLNAIDPKYGWTPLQRATFCGHKSIVKILIDSGADDIFIQGTHATHIAATEGDLDILQLILDKNPALLDAKDSNQLTAIHWAARMNRPKIFHYLFLQGATLDSTMHCPGSPTHASTIWDWLYENKDHDAINMLIKAGFKPQYSSMSRWNWGFFSIFQDSISTQPKLEEKSSASIRKIKQKYKITPPALGSHQIASSIRETVFHKPKIKKLPIEDIEAEFRWRNEFS